MLTILGRRTGGYCDGVTRRNFLRIGGMAVGGLSLVDVLRSEAQAESGVSHKAVINVFLPGGPPHQDMWGSQAWCTERNSWRILANSYQRSGNRDLRIVSQDRRDDGQVRSHPVDRGCSRAALCDAVHDRLPRAKRSPYWWSSHDGGLGVETTWQC